QLMPGRRFPALHTMSAGGGIDITASRTTRAEELSLRQSDKERGILHITVPVVDLIMVVNDQGIDSVHDGAFALHIGLPSAPSPLTPHPSLVWSHGFHNRYRNICSRAGVAVDQTAFGVLDLQLVVSQMLPDRALQLPERKHGLHQSCGPDRMAAG